MSTLAFVLTAMTAGLLALAYWWIRRCNPAAALDGPPSLALRPLSTDCEIGRQLQMASAAGAAGAGTPRGSGGGAGAATAPQRKKPTGPSRRAFLRGSLAFGWLGVLGGFSAASLAYLWPDLRGGFGAVLDAGDEEEILEDIRSNREPYEFGPGRTYFVEYNEAEDPDGVYADLTNGARIMALYWTCVHLGCKVPWCASAQWLECACHGSAYNRWGEYQDGPAPRGLDRFRVEIQDGVVMVDTSVVVSGPSRGAGVLDQPREGPSCI
ncbi:MAG TPA: Rieske 2Fe-2S domain-containing protein [Egibacteraceae bacterium]|nr:Rieske 2Fe-2S domain-containing protein [Egibacteraceae bacterium]